MKVTRFSSANLIQVRSGLVVPVAILEVLIAFFSKVSYNPTRDRHIRATSLLCPLDSSSLELSWLFCLSAS